MSLELDHLAISAATLSEGRAMVEAALGVALQPGGQHSHFGTHNLLLGLEDGLYLEVIAIDPKAGGLPYPRWFDLDRFSGSPRLSNWICRTDDLNHIVDELPGAGDPVALERGDLRWQMAVPGDGVLPFENCFPALMEWQSDVHPATRLEPSGCRLRRFTVRHPQAEALKSRLNGYLSDDRIAFETGEVRLEAEFTTPSGIAVLA